MCCDIQVKKYQFYREIYVTISGVPVIQIRGRHSIIKKRASSTRDLRDEWFSCSRSVCLGYRMVNLGLLFWFTRRFWLFCYTPLGAAAGSFCERCNKFLLLPYSIITAALRAPVKTNSIIENLRNRCSSAVCLCLRDLISASFDSLYKRHTLLQACCACLEFHLFYIR